MLKLVLLISLLTSGMSIMAQYRFIAVTYKESAKLLTQGSPITDPAALAMIQKQLEKQTRYMELDMNEGKSSYTLPDHPDDFVKGSYYKDQTKHFCLEQTLFHNHHFLVKEAIASYSWKLSSEHKKIIGYLCQKATTDSGKVTAWYCPEFAIHNGPACYGDLPGLILEVETGNKIYEAQAIEFGKEKPITAPTQGEAISQEEFEHLKQERIGQIGI